MKFRVCNVYQGLTSMKERIRNRIGKRKMFIAMWVQQRLNLPGDRALKKVLGISSVHHWSQMAMPLSVSRHRLSKEGCELGCIGSQQLLQNLKKLITGGFLGPPCFQQLAESFLEEGSGWRISMSTANGLQYSGSYILFYLNRIILPSWLN